MPDHTIEIINGREGRRRWSVEEKLRIVAETHEPGAMVGAVAARHDVYPSLLRARRRQVRDGHLAAAQVPHFVPVCLTEPPPPASATAPPANNHPRARQSRSSCLMAAASASAAASI
jgi:transposase